jgi:hypothetical protein|tara:strand:- start:3664 stop:4131 length:468 start_codon:yes stop_codon:yes gene_type:complete
VKRFFIFDSGWLFLFAGSALLWSAIVLPAEQELESLRERLTSIQGEFDHISHRIDEYQIFYDSLANRDPALLERIIRMQTTGAIKGDYVVFDPNAAKTPLEWLNRRTSQEALVVQTRKPNSMLEKVTAEDRRLWVAGFGGLIVFVGLVQGPRRDD